MATCAMCGGHIGDTHEEAAAHFESPGHRRVRALQQVEALLSETDRLLGWGVDGRRVRDCETITAIQEHITDALIVTRRVLGGDDPAPF